MAVPDEMPFSELQAGTEYLLVLEMNVKEWSLLVVVLEGRVAFTLHGPKVTVHEEPFHVMLLSETEMTLEAEPDGGVGKPLPVATDDAELDGDAAKTLDGNAAKTASANTSY